METAVKYVEPFEKRFGALTVRLRQGDLTALDVDAFVFYAREDLALGTGYGTAIQMRGGAAVKKELEKIGSIGMGEAVVTGAGEIKAGHIIHACGPKFQEADMEAKLRSCMESSLRAAAAKGFRTVAFPPMGTGFYGVPQQMSARVMIETIKSFAGSAPPVEEIVICTVDRRDYAPFREVLEKS
ncbi:MAG: macro domain-containing protein [bacterium]